MQSTFLTVKIGKFYNRRAQLVRLKYRAQGFSRLWFLGCPDQALRDTNTSIAPVFARKHA
jgi:hypothetical protein